jgi:precorrin-6A/cobalt-precorrin-6A reductase
MHSPSAHQPARRLWLFAGTGDGPPLAVQLLALGWQLRVSVVTVAAGRAYPVHPALELRVGALGGAATLTRELLEARQQGRPFGVVVDATHPFASRIHRELERGTAAAGVPLRRLERENLARPPGPAGAHTSGARPDGDGRVRELADLAGLRAEPLAGTRLLLAIGSRHLARALRCCPGALHHARVLPEPAALRQALAAGLAPGRLAVLHPRQGKDQPAGAVEEALVRRWGIEAILARASGPPTETLWRRIAAAQGCRLLLLRRPRQDLATPGLSRAELLRTLAAWPH